MLSWFSTLSWKLMLLGTTEIITLGEVERCGGGRLFSEADFLPTASVE